MLDTNSSRLKLARIDSLTTLYEEVSHNSNTDINNEEALQLLSNLIEQVTDKESKFKLQSILNSSLFNSQKVSQAEPIQTINNNSTKQLQTIRKKIYHDTEAKRLRDKITFAISVCSICITTLLTFRFPQWIPLYYTIHFLCLITYRVWVYKSKQWHYFFFDLCYFVNALILLYLWVFPSSTLLFSVIFTLTNGPVIWAIVTWRNSLVFHSIDKVTSVFIHLFPALVIYVLRWLPELHTRPEIALVLQDTHYSAVSDLPTMGWWYTINVSTVSFLIWQISYVLFVIIGRGEKIKSGARTASYSTLLTENEKSKSFILDLACIFGVKYKLYMFLLWQFLYSLGTCALTYFYYQSFLLHTICIAVMFIMSVWNGATYYIDAFSNRHWKDVERSLNDLKEKKRKCL